MEKAIAASVGTTAAGVCTGTRVLIRDVVLCEAEGLLDVLAGAAIGKAARGCR